MARGPLVFFGLASQSIYNDIDKAMLGRLSTLGAAGAYTAGYRIIDFACTPSASRSCCCLPALLSGWRARCSRLPSLYSSCCPSRSRIFFGRIRVSGSSRGGARSSRAGLLFSRCHSQSPRIPASSEGSSLPGRRLHDGVRSPGRPDGVSGGRRGDQCPPQRGADPSLGTQGAVITSLSVGWRPRSHTLGDACLDGSS